GMRKRHASQYANFGSLRMYINTHQEDVLVAIRHSGGQSLRSSETRKTNACKRLLYIHGSPTTRRLSAEESVANV
ncbi:MAG: hypothetical protein ACLSF1_11325, partial [Bacteroides thetaiotaomicron]